MTDSGVVYLDYNASTPLSESVAAAMRPYLVGYSATAATSSQALFGNPSSSHKYGTAQRQAIENARFFFFWNFRLRNVGIDELSCRKQVARCLRAPGGPDEIVFTSGGTESNNYALCGVVRAARSVTLSISL